LTDTPKRKKTGGGPKKAPPGYYRAKEAQERLGMTPSAFSYYVRQGRIKKHVPPMRVEGFYEKKEIDLLANEMALFLHTHAPEEVTSTEVRPALPVDTEGIVHVLAVMGWQTTTPEQRESWYAVNPFIDFVALLHGEVMGYIHAVPYTEQALEDIMSGVRRSWHMTPQDILAYEPGRSYDLYVGIATRQDIPQHTQRFGFRLLSGFISFLEELATQGITIRRMYAVSAEEDGQKLCKDLGFIEQPAQPGDLFPRFMLDLETSNAHFARVYRTALHRIN